MDLYSATPSDSRPPFNAHRQRSPLTARPPGGRDRSHSPARNIDRYQPSPRDYDDNRRVPRRPPPGLDRRSLPSQPPPPPHVDRYVPGETPSRMSHQHETIPHNHLRDPLLEQSQVTFSYFAEWWKTEQDIERTRRRRTTGHRLADPDESHEDQRARLQVAYDEYKCVWNARTAKIFVQTHRNEAWFREKYVQPVRDPIRLSVNEYRNELFKYWVSDLDNGTFDDFTMEGIYKSDSDGVGGVAEKEEGETAAANEVLAISDLLPAKGADLRDPVASMPALLIKTITPAASRDALEAFCKEQLGDGDGGFKWLSLSDPNMHKKFHRLGWVLLNPGAGATDEPSRHMVHRDANGDADVFDSEAMQVDGQQGASIQESALRMLDNKTMTDPIKGDFTLHVGLHKPHAYPRKRALWDVFSAPERVLRDLELVLRLIDRLDQRLDAEHRASPRIEQRVEDLIGKGCLQPPLAAVKVKNDDDAADDVEEGQAVEPEVRDDVDDEDALIAKKKLDLSVEYLRRVHNCCFYCVFESDSVHELQRKCASGHLRRPRASLTMAAKEVAKATTLGQDYPDLADSSTKADGQPDDVSPVEMRKSNRPVGKSQLQKAFNWVKTFEDKLYQWLEPENVDIARLGGLPIEQALNKELAQYVKQEDEAKWRCKVPDCAKLFKGKDFWRKHIEKRHTDWLAKLKDDIQVINDYVLDPAKLALGRSDAASNGHFPVPRDNMMGTPRHGYGGMPAYNGFAPGVTGSPMFPTFAGQYAMGLLPSYGPPAGVHSGPMRSGPRIHNARGPSAPYERGPRRSLGGAGDMSPSGLSRGRGPAFVEGGVGTFSSGSALEGRTMKSYNDLDASAGATSEADALDY